MLVGAGLCEAFTLPLVAPAEIAATGLPVDAVVEVENPLRTEESVLRTALLPGLLAALGTNVARGNTDAALFELGTVFGAPVLGTVLPSARPRLRGRDRVHCATGRSVPTATSSPPTRSRGSKRSPTRCGWPTCGWSPAVGAGFDAGPARRLVVDGAEVGSVGQVAATAVAHHGVAASRWRSSSTSAASSGAARRSIWPSRVSRFPSSSVDLAFVVADTVPAGDVLRRPCVSRAATCSRASRCSTRSVPTRSGPVA